MPLQRAQHEVRRGKWRRLPACEQSGGHPCPPFLRTAQPHRQTIRRQHQRVIFHIRTQRPPRRTLRHHAQRDGLLPRKLRGRPTEIELTCRAHAFDVPPIRREVEIRLEDLRLCKMPLDLQRAKHLHELPAHRPRAQPVAQPRELHGDRGSAAASAATEHRVPARAQSGHRVDAGVMPEMLILVQQCGLDQLRRNLRERRVEPVAVIRRQRHPQQTAIAIQHALGVAEAVERGWRGEEQPPAAEHGQQKDQCLSDKRQWLSPFPRAGLRSGHRPAAASAKGASQASPGQRPGSHVCKASQPQRGDPC